MTRRWLLLLFFVFSTSAARAEDLRQAYDLLELPDGTLLVAGGYKRTDGQSHVLSGAALLRKSTDHGASWQTTLEVSSGKAGAFSSILPGSDQTLVMAGQIDDRWIAEVSQD